MPMTPDDDLPPDISAYDPEQEKMSKDRAANHLRISKLSIGNRFRLMCGLKLLPEPLPTKDPIHQKP